MLLEISQNLHENTCVRVSILTTSKPLKCQGLYFYNFIKIEILARVLSCEFCKISKNTFLYRTPLVITFSLKTFNINQFSVFVEVQWWGNIMLNVLYSYEETMGKQSRWSIVKNLKWKNEKHYFNLFMTEAVRSIALQINGLVSIW